MRIETIKGVRLNQGIYYREMQQGKVYTTLPNGSLWFPSVIGAEQTVVWVQIYKDSKGGVVVRDDQFMHKTDNLRFIEVEDISLHFKQGEYL